MAYRHLGALVLLVGVACSESNGSTSSDGPTSSAVTAGGAGGAVTGVSASGTRASGAGGTSTATASGDATASGGVATGSGGVATGSMGSGSGGTIGNAGQGGSSQGSPAGCKRGIATNTPPGAEFSPGVRWWYNWAIGPSGADVGIEFVPMIWGAATAGDPIPRDARFLLGFNEPNFFAQSNLSASEAAVSWPDVEASAAPAGALVVAPGMNFCGPADQCHDTNPYDYYREFFASCEDCTVDHVAVHWYNCDLASLRDYLEPGGNLEGFEQFGRPIWLTEFSCDPSASVAEQEAYMREAIPYLEQNPHVFRYSWFSAGPIPDARLMNEDGSPTSLGQVYIELDAEDCEPASR